MNMVVKCIYFMILIINISQCFMNIHPKRLKITNLKNNINDRKIYGSYLLGLRKTKKLLKINNDTKADLETIVKITNSLVSNYTYINNSNVKAKKIVMSNIVLDVSNIETIEITASNNSLNIELDKNQRDSSIINNVNSIENIVSIITLFGKVVNM
jgi:hypothetical protein